MINLTSASNNRTIAIVRVTCYNLWENFSLKFKKKLCENLNLLRKLYHIFYIGRSWFLEELDIKLGNKIESHLCGIFFPTSFTNRLWCILRTFSDWCFTVFPCGTSLLTTLVIVIEFSSSSEYVSSWISNTVVLLSSNPQIKQQSIFNPSSLF